MFRTLNGEFNEIYNIINPELVRRVELRRKYNFKKTAEKFFNSSSVT